MSLVIKARKITKKNKTKTRKLSKKNHRSKNHRKKKQFGGVTFSQDAANLAYNRIRVIPGTKIFIWDSTLNMLNVFYSPSTETYIRGRYHNLVYSNTNPNPMMSKMTSQSVSPWRFIHPSFGVPKYRYAFNPQLHLPDGTNLQNQLLQTRFFNSSVDMNANNMFRRMPYTVNNALPVANTMTGILGNLNGRMKYIYKQFITPDNTSVNIMKCYTFIWDSHLNPFAYMTPTGYEVAIQNGTLNPWGNTLNSPGDYCRETGNGNIAVGDYARVFRELNFKQLQMDLIMFLQGNRTISPADGMPAGALSCYGGAPHDPAARSAQPLGTPVGPFNAFNTVVYRGQKTNFNFQPVGPGGGVVPGGTHQFLVLNYMSVHCGHRDQTGFWRTPNNSPQNPGYVYEIHMAPGIPFIAYDRQPFRSEFPYEREILLARGCLITTDNPNGVPHYMPGAQGVLPTAAGGMPGHVRLIRLYISYPNAAQINNLIEQGFAGDAGAGLRDSFYPMYLNTDPTHRWDFHVGSLRLGNLAGGWEPIVDSPDDLMCRINTLTDLNSFRMPQYGGKKKHITNKKKYKSKRRFSKKR